MPTAQSLFDVSGRSALVVGATGALGGAVARALSDGGAHLTLTGANVERLEALGDELGAATVARRATSEADAEAMVEAAIEAHGRVDLLLVATGANDVTPAIEQSPEAWRAVLDANLTSSWLVCRAAGRRMIEAGEGGKVLLVSSTRGKLGHPAGYAAYCASKAGVELLVKALACEWGPHAVNVNAIAPTLFRSEITSWMFADDERARAVRDGMLARIPLGRLGEPDDFVGAALYFLSPASNFCTGQILYVDGGYTAG